MIKQFYNTPILLLLTTTFIWGSNTVAGQLAVGEISPMVTTFLRWVVATVILWALFGRQVIRSWPLIRSDWILLLVLSATGFTFFNALFYVASHTTSAINMGILQGTIPVFVLLGVYFLYGSSITLSQLTGVLLTLLGVVVIATKGAPLEIFIIQLSLGDFVMLLACFLYALYTILLKKRSNIDSRVFMTVLSTLAMILSVPLIIIEALNGNLQWPTQNGWFVAIYAGLFVSAFSQLFFLRAIDIIGPVKAGVYVNLVPIASAILSVFILGENFAIFHAISLCLVMVGIWLAQIDAKNKDVKVQRVSPEKCGG